MKTAAIVLLVAAALTVTGGAHGDAWDALIVDHEARANASDLGQEYGLRAIALSPNDNYIYGAWLHANSSGTGANYLYMYDAHQGATPDPGYPDPAQPRHYIERISTGDTNVQFRAVAATSDWVYAGLDKNHPDGSGTYGFDILPSDLSGVAATFALPLPVNGIAVYGNYLYMSERDLSSSTPTAPVLRYLLSDPGNPNVGPSNPELDTSWGVGGVLEVTNQIPGAEYLRGMTTDSAGNVYIAAGADLNPNGTVYRIDAVTGQVTSATVNLPGAMDLAIYHDTLYVTEYTNVTSQIHKLGLNLSDEGFLAGTPVHLYDGYMLDGSQGRNYPGGGYSGIDISTTGNVYLADQYWNDTGWMAGQPAGDPQQPEEILRDRLYESDPIPEPGTIALFGLGIAMLTGRLRRKRPA